MASKNRSGNYLRTKVTPSNPQSFAQQATRAVLGTMSSAWSGLTDDQRATFNGAVSDWSGTNIFGDIKNPTGKNLFVGLNKNLIESGQVIVENAPEKQALPFMEVTAVNGLVGSDSLTVASNGDATGVQVNIYATAPQSAGTGFYKGKYRKIKTVEGSTLDGVDVINEYRAKFGAIAAGMNISFQFKTVGTNGQAGTPEFVKAVILA